MIIAQNKLATTYFHQDEKILVSVYKGRAIIQLALEHLESIVGFYKTNKVLGSIVDVKEVHGSFAKVFEYMKDSYYPIAIKNGLQCQVYVVSEDLIINNLGSKLKGMATLFKLKSNIFSDRDEAEEWVKKNVKAR